MQREKTSIDALIESVKAHDVKLYNRSKYNLEEIQKRAEKRILAVTDKYAGRNKMGIAYRNREAERDNYKNGNINFY